MTNQQAKQEAIKKSWAEIGQEANENIISDNGWRKIKPSQYSSLYDDVDLLKLTSHVHSIRPTALNGIEDNNGWIRIEPDGSNLPKSGEYRWLFESGSMSNFYYEPGDILSTKLTHYKPITPELKPIY